METEVIGHYLVPAAGRPAQPLLHESTSLFQAVVSDRLAKVESAVEADAAKLNQFFLVLHWASDVKGASPEPTAEPLDAAAAAAAKASVMVKQRSLLMIAAHSGSLRVLAYLLARGAEPGRKSPDGLTAYDLAVAGETSSTPTALAMMRDADSNPASSTRSSSNESNSYNGAGGRQDLDSSDGALYSTTDLTRPEYSTDDFRMFNFKVLRCSKRHAHDWRACPFAHPTENARRRDPREFKYCALACPDYKQGFCIRGDVCPYAHGVFECWLHPSRYRTQLCKDGSNCHRPVCFFAHSLPELRAPSFTWVPTQADLARPAAPYSHSNNNSGPGGHGNSGGHGMGAVLPPGAVASAVAALALGAAGDGVITIGASAAAEARALMSHTSSGIPATGSSSDGCCATATCSSPRALSIGGSGNGGNGGSLSGGNGSSVCGGNGSSMCGGNGGSSMTGSSMCGGNGNGSHSSSNGAIGSPSPSGSVGSREGGSREGGSSSSCNSGCGGISAANFTTVIIDEGSKGCHTTGGCPSPGSSAAAAAAAAKLSLNLTQPNAAAGVLGFTAPRMSNAFARRHGLNPKDNPMINLQKIALQSHQPPSQQQPQQPQMQQMQSGNGLGSAASLNGFQQDSQPMRAHHAPVGTGSGSLHAGRGGIGSGGVGGQQRMHAAAAAAAVAASSHSGFAPLGYGASFCGMQAAGHPLSAGAADPSLLAAQLAALNLQQQRQSHHSHNHHNHHNHLGLSLSGINGLGGLSSMSMTSGAAAAAAAAAAMPYMTVAGQHQALLQHHSNMYGAASNGMYDHSQQHHLMAAMSGGQTEV